MTGDNDTITLADAAQHFGFGVATLRAEAARGRLTLYKIGKRFYTTPADIRAMVESCRVGKRDQDSIIKPDVVTSSETERRSSAVAALNLKLNNSSPATSRPSTPRSRHARH
jgi:hypothetical protein